MLDRFTGQRRYENPGSLSRGDWRVVLLGLTLFGVVWFVHDRLGLALPSSHVLEFVEHISPTAILWYGLYRARTRRPE